MNSHAGLVYAMMNSLSYHARNTDPDKPSTMMVGTLSAAPGTGLVATLKKSAAAFGIEFVEIDMAHLEYHPGAIDLSVNMPVEEAVSTGRPVMILLDEAGTAAPGVINAAMKSINSRVEGQPCAVVASIGANDSHNVAAQLAESAGITIDNVINHNSL